MTQKKSANHSPACIEGSPYPPCIPTCRMHSVDVINLDDVEVDPLYEGLFLEPEVHALAITDGNGDLYATFDKWGALTGGKLAEAKVLLEAELDSQIRAARNWRRVAFASWGCALASLCISAGSMWGWW